MLACFANQQVYLNNKASCFTAGGFYAERMKTKPYPDISLDEFLAWRKRSARSDASTIIEIPALNSWNSKLVKLCLEIYLKQLKTKRDSYWRSNRPDAKEANFLKNAKSTQKRKAYWKQRRSDPAYAAEVNRKGVEYFKANKAKVYAYRKSRPDIYGLEANREYMRNWHRNKRATDPQYLLGNRLRSRLWHGVARQGGKKSKKTEQILGCTVAFFRKYIEARFQLGMSWDNTNEWHLDHILPCAKFDLTKLSEQRKAFHYTNVQPLWKRDNLSKSDKTLNQTELSI